MKQLIPRVISGVEYAGEYWAALSGGNQASNTFGAAVARVPFPWAATVRDLTIYTRDSLPNPVTVTVLKNGAATGLTGTLPGGTTGPIYITDVAVAYEQFDDISYRIVTTGGAFPGWTIGACIEVESAGSVYGIRPDWGAVVVNEGGYGGALGNGVWANYAHGANPIDPPSGSYSINAIPGSITTLVLKALGETVPGGSSFIGFLIVDGIPQDGTGGTVDTRCTMTAGNSTAASTFDLPVALAERVEVAYYRTGDAATNPHVAVGVGFVPDDDGWFMLCGHSDGAPATPLGYLWSYSFPSLDEEPLALAPVGPSGLIARGLLVERAAAPGGGKTTTHTVRQNEANTVIAVTLADAETSGQLTNQNVSFAQGDTIAMRVDASALAGGGAFHWGLGLTVEGVEVDAPAAGNGIIGPLIWVVLRRVRQPAGTTSADAFSDLEMQDPSTYYGSYKQPFLLHAGDAERALSDPITGDVVASTFRFVLGDQDEDEDSSAGRLRAQLASEIDKYWTLPAWFFCTTRANRAVLGTPFTAFAGSIVDVQPAFPRALELTLGDLLTERIVNDKLQIPWRLIRDGFLNQLDAVSEKLDLEQPEPIIYGEHNRTAEGSPSTETGYRIEPIYLGIETVNGSEKHVWLIAGHACKDVRVFVDDVEQTEANGWLIPGDAGFQSAFGASYVDKASSTYGTTRRYTLLYGTFGGGARPFGRTRTSNADSCAVGDKTLTVAVQGIESAGDGSGTLITDYYDIYKHFTVNFLANAGPDSYQSGAWLESPQWSNPNGSVVDVVHEASFDDCGDIALERIDGGLIGAVAIGLKAGDRSGPSRWIAEFNRNGFCQSGPVEPFQWGITTLHPTHAIKNAAVHYTDAYEVIEGSFSTAMEWDRHATHFPWRTDYEQTTGVWKSSGVVTSAEVNYYEHKEARVREYLFVPGEQQGEHLATLEAGMLANPPRMIRFDAPIGPDAEDDSLAYRNPGDYITYEHFDAVTEQREERLAYVQRVGVRGSARHSYVVAMDVEDLINFDVGGSPAGSPQ